MMMNKEGSDDILLPVGCHSKTLLLTVSLWDLIIELQRKEQKRLKTFRLLQILQGDGKKKLLDLQSEYDNSFIK
jgi:hypothetical protein